MALNSARTCQVAIGRGVERRDLEEPQSLVDVGLGGERRQSHLGERLRDADDSLELPETRRAEYVSGARQQRES